jgi:hypothetical protein
MFFIDSLDSYFMVRLALGSSGWRCSAGRGKTVDREHVMATIEQGFAAENRLILAMCKDPSIDQTAALVAELVALGDEFVTRLGLVPYAAVFARRLAIAAGCRVPFARRVPARPAGSVGIARRGRGTLEHTGEKGVVVLGTSRGPLRAGE